MRVYGSCVFGRLTIRALRRVDPEARLRWAARLFWLTLAAGTYCTFWVATNPYESILMAISWGAITITCVDIIATSDVRSVEENLPPE